MDLLDGKTNIADVDTTSDEWTEKVLAVLEAQELGGKKLVSINVQARTKEGVLVPGEPVPMQRDRFLSSLGVQRRNIFDLRSKIGEGAALGAGRRGPGGSTADEIRGTGAPGTPKDPTAEAFDAEVQNALTGNNFLGDELDKSDAALDAFDTQNRSLLEIPGLDDPDPFFNKPDEE